MCFHYLRAFPRDCQMGLASLILFPNYKNKSPIVWQSTWHILASWKKLHHRTHICTDRTTWHRATIVLLRASLVFPARACFLCAKKSAAVTTNCRQVRSLSIGLGTFSLKTENRTEPRPNRNVSFSVRLRFLVLAISVFCYFFGF
jgi:hypothetical protein